MFLLNGKRKHEGKSESSEASSCSASVNHWTLFASQMSRAAPAVSATVKDAETCVCLYINKKEWHFLLLYKAAYTHSSNLSPVRFISVSSGFLKTTAWIMIKQNIFKLWSQHLQQTGCKTHVLTHRPQLFGQLKLTHLHWYTLYSCPAVPFRVTAKHHVQAPRK